MGKITAKAKKKNVRIKGAMQKIQKFNTIKSQINTYFIETPCIKVDGGQDIFRQQLQSLVNFLKLYLLSLMNDIQKKD